MIQSKIRQHIKTGTWVNVTDEEEETYTSDTLECFIWREKDSYRHGQLGVKFNSTSKKYFYDVPRIVFEEMTKRAYNPDKYNESTWNWYDTYLVDYVDEDRRAKNDVLYLDTI